MEKLNDNINQRNININQISANIQQVPNYPYNMISNMMLPNYGGILMPMMSSSPFQTNSKEDSSKTDEISSKKYEQK